MEKDLKNPSYCKPQGDGNNRVTNRGDPNNSEVITNLIIVDNTKSTTNYTDVVTNNVDPDNEVIPNLSITANSADVDNSRAVKANINNGG